MMVRYALYFLGLLLAMPALALTGLASVTPITVSGVVYLIGCWLMIVGLIVGRWQPKYQLALTVNGFMGNVVLQCWQIAQAVEKIGAITVCPSTSWSGDWWQPAGEAIVRATMRYLRGRGMERFYLGGFSNGGHGIGSLAPRLTTEPGLRGLFFIAGVYNGAAIRTTTLPVLIMQGVADERLPVAAARRFAGELGNQATYVELEADHFLIVKQSREVQAVLRTWLEGRESR